jgi:hypothetical protein
MYFWHLAYWQGQASANSFGKHSADDLCACFIANIQPKNMARLGIEPRLPDYIPGALPLSYLALGNQC